MPDNDDMTWQMLGLGRRWLALAVGFAAMAAAPTRAAAQPAPRTDDKAAPAQPAVSRTETEFLVPPQGGAFQVPLHAGEVCILSFPDKMSGKALTSSPDFELKAWGEDGVAVRAIGAAAQTTTLALATKSGQIKVNVTLTVVAASKPAYTLVRFKAVSAEEALEAQVKEQVARQLELLRADLDSQRRELERQRQLVDTLIRDRADGLLADRLLKRNETVTFKVHERNDDHVIVHVTRGALVGDDGYLVFELENRSGAAYRLMGVRVQSGDRDIGGPARLTSPSTTRDPGAIGVVPSGATGRGIVVVRSVDQVLGKSLTLTVSGPPGSPPIRLEGGIVFR